jgi:ribosomal protein S18 acetylase RimI-like enzyme
MFLRLLEDLPGIVFLAKLEKQIMGVMRMKSCNGREVSDEYVKSEDVKDINWRKSYWHNEWARHDPTEQHWHLGPIGVLPAYQGTGIGTKLMRRFCHEVDTCLAAAYLETDLDKNVAFYGRFDFQIIAESEIFNVKNYYMWRPPIQRRDHGQKRRHP